MKENDYGLISGTVPAFAWRDLSELKWTSVRRVGVNQVVHVEATM
jgi:hypothetical protein